MKRFFTLMVLVAVAATLSAQVPFTKGNIVVLRMGDGTNTYDLSATKGVPFFLDEYKYDQDNNTVSFVQSVPLPTTIDGANKRCLGVPGSINSHGMTRSADGRFLVIPGYEGELGTTPWGQVASTNNRVVALVKSDATIDTKTALTNVFNKGDIRSATSYDGTDIWVSGSQSNGGDVSGGTFYTTAGSTTGLRIGTTHTSTRYVKIYDGQLYISVLERIYAGGPGMPKTGGNTFTDLTQATNGNDKAGDGYGFFIGDLDPANPGTKRVMYFADAGGGIIKKYSLVGGVWTLNGSIAVSSGIRGLEGSIADGVVTLYAVQHGSNPASGTGTLYVMQDDKGYNTAPDTSPDAVLDFGGTYKTMVAVAMAPQATSLLPIKLTAFTAQKLQNSVRLSWSTSSENNNSHYEILRSDGNEWKVIGKVQGNGTTNQNSSYNFTDTKPLLGVSYYQLRQVDFDGKSELSKIVPVKIDMLVSGLSVAASADKQQVQLTLNAEKAGQANITISNVTGQKIAQSVKHAEKGLNNFTVSAKLKKGVYVVAVNINGFKQVSKFVVE